MHAFESSFQAFPLVAILIKHGRSATSLLTDESVCSSDNVPHVLGGVAELPARHAGTEAEITDADGVVLEAVGEVVVPLGHGTYKDAYTLPRA